MITVRLFNHYIPASLVILGALESLILMASTYAGTLIVFYGKDIPAIEKMTGPIFPKAVVFSALVVLSMASIGLYQRDMREGKGGIAVRFFIAFLASIMGTVLVFYLIPSLHLGRGALALTAIIGFTGVASVRTIIYRLVEDETLKRQVLILGAGACANRILHNLRRRSDKKGFHLLGFIPIPEEDVLVPTDKLLLAQSSIFHAAQTLQADEIVVAADDRRKNFPLHDLLNCKMAGIEVVDLQTFYEREAGKLNLECLSHSWLIFSPGFGQGWFRELSKRSFDIISSLLILLIGLPFMLVTIIAIKIEDAGPIFYRQIRVGKDDINIGVLKFRSMRTDAEKNGAQWATTNDSRITKVGKWIRATRVDELPQLFNVLRGDMSFVGPRPERPEFVKEFIEKIEYYDERHRVKPGITGWAQIRYPYGSSDKDAEEKLQYDLYYAKNYNLLFDITILLQTVEVVLFRKGSR